MNTRKDARLKRAKKTRAHIKTMGAEKGTPRLTIMRTPRHIYVQVIAPQGGNILAAASSLELRAESDLGAKVDVAKRVGSMLAERAKENGVTYVACDRSGFKFHGRVAALVNAVREAGIQV